MKQRLLLSLLMLMVSVGLVKAAVEITVPKGETLKITISGVVTPGPVVSINGTDQYTFSADGYWTVSKDDANPQTVSIKNSFGGLKLEGKATALKIHNDGLETLDVSNLGLTSLKLTSATGLKKVDISNNKELTAITGSGAFSAAEEINASNCGFTEWPTAFNAATTLKKVNVSNNALTEKLDFTSFAALEDLNVANNELQNDELTVPSKLKKLDVSGNHLRYIGGVTKEMDVTFGTQTYTAPAGFTADANKGLDFTNSDPSLNIAFDEPDKKDVNWLQVKATWKRLENGTYVSRNHGHKVLDAEPSTFYFFDANNKNIYQEGTYQATLVYGEATLIIDNIVITPAKFNLDIVDDDNINVTNQQTNAKINDGDEVTQGTVILVATSDAAEDAGKELDSFKTTALSEQTFSDKDHKAFRVEGYWDANQKKDIHPSIEAELKDAMLDITFKKSVDGTNNSIVAEAQKGDQQPISLTPGNTTEVPYGSKIKVTFKAEPGYEPSIFIDGTDKSDDIKEVAATNTYEYETLAKTDLAITTNITKTNTVAITLKLEGEATNISQKVFAPNSVIKVDGKPFQSDGTITNNITVTDFPANTEVQLSFALTCNAVFGGDVWANNPITLASITYGSESVSWTMKEVSNSVADGNQAAREYVATFNTGSVDQDLVIRTKKNVKVEIIPTPDNTSATGNKTQKHVYDGKEHPFAYKTNPEEYYNEVEVKYTLPDGTSLNDGAPTEAGTYNVTCWLPATEDHQRVTKDTHKDWKVVIEPAQPTVTTKPKVEVKDGKYVISGGVAKGIDGKELYGKWEVLDSNGDPVQTTSKTAETVEVRFTALVESSKAEDKNYKTATVSTTTGTMPEYAVAFKNIPDGIEITLYNGDLEIDQDTKVPEGTKVKVKMYVPDYNSIPDINLKKNDDSNNITWAVSPDSNSRTIIFETVTIEEPTVFTIDYTGEKFDLNKNFTVTSGETTVTYNGSEPEFTNFIILDANNKEVDLEDLDGEYFSYTRVINETTQYAVDKKPKNAGTYNVYLTIPYQGNKDQTYKEYEALENAYVGTLNIAKVPTEIVTPPRPTLIPKGQDLSQSNLVGGVAKAVNEKGEAFMTVAGTFEWYEYTSVPEDGELYKVVFWPDESENYDYSTKDVNVTVSDKNLITIKDPGAQVGSISVTNAKTGERFYGEEEIAEGTILRFQVTPAANFRFEQLLVNGSSWNPNEVYTVGNESVAVSAVFSLIEPEIPEPEEPDPVIDENSQYIVEVKKATTNNRGFILHKEGKNGVNYEDPFEFTVNALDADLDKLVVTGATKVSKGKYRINSVTSNTTVTVSLPNPTPIDVKIVTESKNTKGYLVGKVKAEQYPLDGKCYYGDELVVVAYPVDGVSFAHWRDNTSNRDQMREITVTKAMTIEAVFSGVPTGIEDIESAGIYAGRGYIQVKNVSNADLTVVSISGRIQTRQHLEGDVQVRVPAGVYVVVLENGQDVKRVKVIVR